MNLQLTKLELRNVLGLGPELALSFGRTTGITGRNGAGKSSVLRAINCALGLSGESVSALAPLGPDGTPVEGLVTEIVAHLSGPDGEYRIQRRSSGKALQLQVREGESWRSLDPPDRHLAELYDRKSSPAVFASPKLTDAKRIELLLEVAEVPGYDRAKVLEAAGLQDFKLQPIPAKLHPVDDLGRVQAQVFAARTDVERDRRVAAGTAETLESGLPTEEPGDVTFDLDSAKAELESAKDRQQEAANRFRDAMLKIELKLSEDISNLKRSAEIERESLRAAYDASDAPVRKHMSGIDVRIATLEQKREQFHRDAGIRAKAREARDKAAALEAQKAKLTAALQRLKSQAASYISEAVPGARVTFDDAGKLALEIDTDSGWKPWSAANTARQHEVASEWATLHQALHARDGQPGVALVLLDDAEKFDTASGTRLFQRLSEAGQVIATIRTDGPLSVEATS